MTASQQIAVDVVVVTFNSSRHVHNCLRPLSNCPWARIVVVDNASEDDTVDRLAGEPVTCLPQNDNLGFAVASNVGWRAGAAPFVLFLNPDACLEPAELLRLLAALEEDAEVGIVAPRFFHPDGTPAFYLRRFPRISSAFARAFFVHRIALGARSDEVIRNPAAYQTSGPAEWLPGACLLVRRSLLDTLGGFDEGFFMYCEDKDLCRRAQDAGFRVWYEAAATCIHEGQGSAPRASLIPVMAVSRVRYLEKHAGAVSARVQRAALVLEALTRIAFGGGGLERRRAQAHALAALLGSSKHGIRPPRRSSQGRLTETC